MLEKLLCLHNRKLKALVVHQTGKSCDEELIASSWISLFGLVAQFVSIKKVKTNRS
jgi:hypothetical protein